LLAIVYQELKHIARRHMSRERPDHTLQATALANEAYIKLVADRDYEWKNRQHFFAVAASAMRRILVDHARARGSLKRGGDVIRINIDDTAVVRQSNPAELIDLDNALMRLAELDPRQCRIVELKFFAGLTEEEIGEVLGVNSRTVKRHWKVARAWLHGELSPA